uniref:Uncharacterized protein n=1 Tax=Tanacetum cinerariifolium TaxID=118510 RepID=A0A6L2JGZ0_TANCI|nr:hypothetical protein [Tanacetum cinerariifolium]
MVECLEFRFRINSRQTQSILLVVLDLDPRLLNLLFLLTQKLKIRTSIRPLKWYQSQVREYTADTQVEGRQADIYHIDTDHAAKVLKVVASVSETVSAAVVPETISAAVIPTVTTPSIKVAAPLKVDVPSTRRRRGFREGLLGLKDFLSVVEITAASYGFYCWKSILEFRFDINSRQTQSILLVVLDLDPRLLNLLFLLVQKLKIRTSIRLLKWYQSQVREYTADTQVKGRQADIYHIDTDHAEKVLSMQEDESEVYEAVEVVTTAKLITEVVAAVSKTVSVAVVIPSTVLETISDVVIPTVTTLSIKVAAPLKVVVPSTKQRRGVVIRDPEEESSEKTPTETKSKDKGKGILVEEPKPIKKKQKVEMDEDHELAARLRAEEQR